MAPSYQKPENALKRAEELIAVSQQSSALTLLHEILLSKRARTTPIPVLEPIVLKFIQLSVELGRSKTAKEGLYQFKNIALAGTITTLETVIKKFLSLSEERLAQAQAKADRILDSVEDLEASETPESILLSAVSTDEKKDRMDREHVTPWLRFLWEAYRTSLDTLRNNARLEVLYQHVAHQAFAFCLKYDRKTEFRRLCEVLRQHLVSSAKYAHQPHAIDLNDPETLQRHLDTRFIQLNAAAELEHWQEGFRSIEDIFGLLEMSQKAPKAYMMANYYEKLARIFMVGDNYLFHAAAFSKYFSIMRQNKKLSQEELARMASIVLLSVLAIPHSGTDTDESKSRLHRLSSLLRSKQVPTREQLLKEALGKNVFPLVRPEFKALYEILEVEFHPLSICTKVAPIFQFLTREPELQRYLKPIHSVILTRLLQQLSLVYSSIQLESIVSLAAFPAPFNYDVHGIEKFIMNTCKSGHLSIRVDHSTGSLVFESDLFSGRSSTTKICNELNRFSSRLQAVSAIVNPAAEAQRVKKRTQALKDAAENAQKECIATYMRRALIEKKKEMREQALAEKEKEEQRLKQEKLLQEQEAARIRAEEESKRREQERLLNLKKDIEKQEAQKMAEKLAQELSQKNVKLNKEDLESMDTAKLKELQIQQLEKERKDLAIKTKTLTKRYDHIERAYRQNEIPLLDADFERQQKTDRDIYTAHKKAVIEESKIKFSVDLEIKKRVSIMLDDAAELKAKLAQRENDAYQKIKDEMDKKLAEAKEKRKNEVLEKRKAEKARKAAEEEAKAAALEAAEKRKAEEAERAAKLEETVRKQRERERIAEEKINAGLRPSEPATDKYVPPSRRGWEQRSRPERPSFDQRPSQGDRPSFGGDRRNDSSMGSNGRWRAAPSDNASRDERPSSGGPPRIIGAGSWRERLKEKENNK